MIQEQEAEQRAFQHISPETRGACQDGTVGGVEFTMMEMSDKHLIGMAIAIVRIENRCTFPMPYSFMMAFVSNVIGCYALSSSPLGMNR